MPLKGASNNFVTGVGATLERERAGLIQQITLSYRPYTYLECWLRVIPVYQDQFQSI